MWYKCRALFCLFAIYGMLLEVLMCNRHLFCVTIVHVSGCHVVDPTDNLWYQLDKQGKEIHKLNVPMYNGFDDMIRLTKEGKMWHYPIDNEQGTNVRGGFPKGMSLY